MIMKTNIKRKDKQKERNDRRIDEENLLNQEEKKEDKNKKIEIK